MLFLFFQVSDLATNPLQMKRTAFYPSLHYVTAMHAAPAPFMRTTIINILPRFVVSNERLVPLWVRECVFSGSSGFGKFGKPKSSMVSYVPIPAKAAVEFHPQVRDSLDGYFKNRIEVN